MLTPSEIEEQKNKRLRKKIESKKKLKQRVNEQRRKFLLTFFDKEKGYKEKEVNGFWLVKSWNKIIGKWQVAIFTKESFERYKKYKNGRLKMA